MENKQNELSRSKRDSSTATKSVNRQDWVETTTIQPRERPKAGRRTPNHTSSAHAPVAQPSVVVTSEPNDNQCGNTQTYEQNNMFTVNQTAPDNSATADLLGLFDKPSAMTQSLDSTLSSPPSNGFSSTNPFGDDFGKLQPSQITNNLSGMSSSYNDITSSSVHQFDDSFGNMALHPPAVNPSHRRVIVTNLFS